MIEDSKIGEIIKMTEGHKNNNIAKIITDNQIKNIKHKRTLLQKNKFNWLKWVLILVVQSLPLKIQRKSMKHNNHILWSKNNRFSSNNSR